MLIRCGFGIAGRVCSMANGLSRAREITFVWRVNEQCPLTHREVFPNGIPGVTFDTKATRAPATHIGPMPIDIWEAAEDRETANSAYLSIMAAMCGEARQDAPAIACFARYFRKADVPPFNLGRATGILAAQRGHSAAFVLADCNRAEIARGLSVAGVAPVFPESPEMTEDMDRTGESVRAYIRDWKTLLAAKAIVCASEESGVMFPAFAAGTETLAIDAPTILQ